MDDISIVAGVQWTEQHSELYRIMRKHKCRRTTELTLPPPMGIEFANTSDDFREKRLRTRVVDDFVEKIIPHIQAEENEKAGHIVKVMRRLEKLYTAIEEDAFKKRYPKSITYKKEYETSYAVMMKRVNEDKKHAMIENIGHMKGIDTDTFKEFYAEIFRRVERSIQLEHEKKNHKRKHPKISEISKRVKAIRDEHMGASTPLDTSVIDLHEKIHAKRAAKAKRLSKKKSAPVTEELRRKCFKTIDMQRYVPIAIGKAKMAGVCGDELVAFTKELQSYYESKFARGKH
eukprot:g1423.t1